MPDTLTGLGGRPVRITSGRWVMGLALAVALAGTGCRKAEAVPEHPLYLDSVDGPSEAVVGHHVVFVIKGHKPDPAWQVDSPVISRKGYRVTVEVVGHRAHKGMAVQMLVPFTTTATLSDLPAGTFTVEFRGQQQTLVRHLDISR